MEFRNLDFGLRGWGSGLRDSGLGFLRFRDWGKLGPGVWGS